MSVFHAIAAMSENRVIGHHGKIPWHLPEDFRWFKHKTIGGTLIMGRKTFESIGKPLPGRKTIVLTHSATAMPGVEICSDIERLKDELNQNKVPPAMTYWVCGGAQIYEALLPICMHLYLTRVKKNIEGDTHFPDFETSYKFESVIHENNEFRVERWINFKQVWRPYSPFEDWPL